MPRVWNELLTFLAITFLIAFSYPAFVLTLNSTEQSILNVIQWICWLAFAADLIYGSLKSQSWKRHLIRNPIQVIAVALPFLRPLQELRLISFGTLALERVAFARSMTVTVRAVITILFLTYIAAVQMTLFERDADGSNIQNFGDGLWWAFVSIATVGYGDTYPVTAEGKVLAVALLLIGISLLAVITASIAATFVQYNLDSAKKNSSDNEQKLEG